VSQVDGGLAQLAKGASIVFIGTVIGKVLALLGQIFIVRSLPPGEFGTIALAFTIVSAISGVLVLGTPQGAARLIAADDETRRKTDILRSALTIAAISGLIGAIGVYLLRFRIQQLTDTPGLAHLLSIFALFVITSPIQKVLIGGLRGFKRPGSKVLANDIFGRISALSLFIGFLLVGEPYFGAVAYWFTLPILVFCAAAYFLNRSVALPKIIRTLPSVATTKEFLSYSWPLAFSSSFVLLMSQLDILMIGYFLAPSDVGLYRAIQPLKEIVLFFLTSFTFLYLPIATEYFTQNKYQELNTLYTTATKWIVTATFPIVLTCILFPQDIIFVLFTERYLPASTAFVILILGMFSRVFVGPNGAMVQAIGETRIEMYAALIGGISNGLFNIILVPEFGIEGAALATSLGFVVYNSTEIIAIYQRTGIIPFSTDIVKPILPTVVFGFIVFYTLREIQLDIIALLLIGIAFSFVHVFSVVFTRSVDSGDQLIIDQISDRIGIDLTWVISK
jgi:O-antigen/teichoic acid export membrane protein